MGRGWGMGRGGSEVGRVGNRGGVGVCTPKKDLH